MAQIDQILAYLNNEMPLRPWTDETWVAHTVPVIKTLGAGAGQSTTTRHLLGVAFSAYEMLVRQGTGDITTVAIGTNELLGRVAGDIDAFSLGSLTDAGALAGTEVVLVDSSGLKRTTTAAIAGLAGGGSIGGSVSNPYLPYASLADTLADTDIAYAGPGELLGLNTVRAASTELLTLRYGGITAYAQVEESAGTLGDLFLRSLYATTEVQANTLKAMTGIAGNALLRLHATNKTIEDSGLSFVSGILTSASLASIAVTGASLTLTRSSGSFSAIVAAVGGSNAATLRVQPSGAGYAIIELAGTGPGKFIQVPSAYAASDTLTIKHEHGSYTLGIDVEGPSWFRDLTDAYGLVFAAPESLVAGHLQQTPAPPTGGADEWLLYWDETLEEYDWIIISAIGGGTPGGSSGQVQFNNAGSFGGAEMEVTGKGWRLPYAGTAATAATGYTTVYPHPTQKDLRIKQDAGTERIIADTGTSNQFGNATADSVLNANDRVLYERYDAYTKAYSTVQGFKDFALGALFPPLNYGLAIPNTLVSSPPIVYGFMDANQAISHDTDTLVDPDWFKTYRGSWSTDWGDWNSGTGLVAYHGAGWYEVRAALYMEPAGSDKKSCRALMRAVYFYGPSGVGYEEVVAQDQHPVGSDYEDVLNLHGFWLAKNDTDELQIYLHQYDGASSSSRYLLGKPGDTAWGPKSYGSNLASFWWMRFIGYDYT